MSELQVPGGEIDDWLAVLKPYQRSTLSSFLRSSTPEQAAERWLGATGSPNIIPFGGTEGMRPFWDRFKQEFRRFVCDDSAYVEEKKSLSADAPVSKSLLVSAISAAIGASIGYQATLLAPAIALMLYVLGKMGRNAYCSAG